nr:serine/threonine-protein kinase [Gordonia sp. NB41Y]
MGQTAPRVGEVFGPYRLESLLGRGGMGEVYRAHDTTRDRDVALKLLPAHLAADPSFQERFRRECQKLARLGEPHIIPIHDYGEIDSTLFLDMRLVDGRDLRAILTDRGRLDPAAAIGLIEQVAAALDAAHAAGLVHRDIKPDNVLVTDSGFAYLIDFGVAHADNEAHLTKTGTAIGSLAYMSPEQFENAPVTSVSDVYSLAAVLFELLTGRQPYPGDSVSAVTRGVLFDEVPVPSQVVPSIEPALDEVVAWGLCKTPAQRCPSALEFAAAARAALSGERPRAGADNPMVSLSKAPPTLAPPTPAVPVGDGAPAGTAERAPETITAGSPPAPSAIDPTLIRPHPLPAHQVTEVAGHLAAGHSAPPPGPTAARADGSGCRRDTARRIPAGRLPAMVAAAGIRGTQHRGDRPGDPARRARGGHSRGGRLGARRLPRQFRRRRDRGDPDPRPTGCRPADRDRDGATAHHDHLHTHLCSGGTPAGQPAMRPGCGDRLPPVDRLRVRDQRPRRLRVRRATRFGTCGERMGSATTEVVRDVV